eukprot:7983517-Pyramimonas_sp.AAC.1
MSGTRDSNCLKPRGGPTSRVRRRRGQGIPWTFGAQMPFLRCTPRVTSGTAPAQYPAARRAEGETHTTHCVEHP